MKEVLQQFSFVVRISLAYLPLLLIVFDVKQQITSIAMLHSA